MEVRTESKTGRLVAGLPEIVERLAQEINRQQREWSQQLRHDPGRLGDVEMQVHQAFEHLADQVVAGLLADVGQQARLAQDAKKK